jgi:prepilin-type N-terminal cleavage/methylation domain-containing protein
LRKREKIQEVLRFKRLNKMVTKFGHRFGSRSGLTLVESLVVLAIIAILVGLLYPALSAYQDMGRRAQCLNNLRQIGIGLVNYAADNDGMLPPANTNWNANTVGAIRIDTAVRSQQEWAYWVWPYLGLSHNDYVFRVNDSRWDDTSGNPRSKFNLFTCPTTRLKRIPVPGMGISQVQFEANSGAKSYAMNVMPATFIFANRTGMTGAELNQVRGNQYLNGRFFPISRNLIPNRGATAMVIEAVTAQVTPYHYHGVNVPANRRVDFCLTGAEPMCFFSMDVWRGYAMEIYPRLT